MLTIENTQDIADNSLRFQMCPHFIKRKVQRGISNQIIALALRYGQRFYEGYHCVFFLGRKQMPKSLDPRIAERADGTVVVLGPDQTLITTYRNPLFVRELKRRHS